MAISWRGVMLVAAISLGVVNADARGFASAEAARELTTLLDERGLSAVAAVDPSSPGAFVAGLYFPGSQLLVVRAHHPSTEGVFHRIETGEYREVYLDLQGTPTPAGKFFVQDAGADGILSVRPGSGSARHPVRGRCPTDAVQRRYPRPASHVSTVRRQAVRG